MQTASTKKHQKSVPIALSPKQIACMELLAAAKGCAALVGKDPLEEVDHEAIDATLRVIIVRILMDSVKRGFPEGIETCVNAANLLVQEIERAHTLHPLVLGEIASKEPNLAVRLSPKEDSFKVANALLKSLKVGTRSVPPTATKVSNSTRWDKLGTKLIHDLDNLKRTYEKDNALDSNSFVKEGRRQERLRMGGLKTKIENLPPRGDQNTQTKGKWWACGKELLKMYWKKNPIDARADFMAIKSQADAAGESPEAHATRLIRKAFFARIR